MTKRGKPRPSQDAARSGGSVSVAGGAQQTRVELPPLLARRVSGKAKESVRRLYELAQAAAEIEAQTARQVREARSHGLSWDVIGAAVGVPGETMRRRHASK